MAPGPEEHIRESLSAWDYYRRGFARVHAIGGHPPATMQRRFVPCGPVGPLGRPFPGDYLEVSLHADWMGHEGPMLPASASFSVRIRSYNDQLWTRHGSQAEMDALWALIVGGGDVTAHDLTDLGDSPEQS